MDRLSSSLPAFPFMAGALAAALLLTADGIWPVAAALALLALAGIFALSNPTRALIFCAVGAVATSVSALILSPATLSLDTRELSIEGTVESPAMGKRGIRAIVIADKADGMARTPFRIRLSVSDHTKPIGEGDRVSIRGVLEPCDRMADIPFMGISSQVNKADRISATMFVKPEQFEITGHSNSLLTRVASLRTAIAERCYSSGLSPEAASLLVGACFGTGDTDMAVKERFRATGLAHLLCVSGFHVGIVAWLLALALWPAKAWSSIGRLRYVIILFGVWLFVAVTGAQPSAIRAATMITAFYLGRLLQRKSSPYNSLALAAGIMIAYNPYNLYSIGFQLSVSAIAGLLVFADRLNMFTINRTIPYRLVSIVTVPLSAMTATAPAVLYWFHRLPLMSVPVNVLATIIFPVFLLGGGISVIFGWQWAVGLTDALCKAILKICDIAISFDDGIMSGIYMNPSTLAILICAIVLCGLALNLPRKSLRYMAGIMAPAAALLLLIPSQSAEAELIAAGNTNGNQLILRHGKCCHVISSKSKMPVDMSDYLKGHAADSLHMLSCDKSLNIGNISVAYAGAQDSSRHETDILLIDGKCKDDISALLATCRPHTVLIGANTSPERCIEIEKACKSREVATRRLFDRSFRAGMSELKALRKTGRD